MDKQYFVYIVTNRPNGTIYTGVTNDLIRRGWEHKQKSVPGFTAKYHLTRLVYYEIHSDINEAIKREKQIKNLVRRKKIALIEKENPEWEDLYDELRR